MTIDSSVGAGGANRPRDVATIQRLLNAHDLAPLAPLSEDGRASDALTLAIRHFQARHQNMPSPDGRVDPGGRTLSRLLSRSSERGTGSSVETRMADRELRARLVDPRVKETGLTTRVIDRILPSLSRIRARVISGYLSDSDLFWKVNYHWEYLLAAIDHAQSLDLPSDVGQELLSLRSRLQACPPDPTSGYTSGALGKPIDRSSPQVILARHAVLASVKSDFRRLVSAARMKDKTRRDPRILDLAGAPVARPGTSKHASGYALDIAGANADIKSACKSLGATLIFDEQSHVHVEFANG